MLISALQYCASAVSVSHFSPGPSNFPALCSPFLILHSQFPSTVGFQLDGVVGLAVFPFLHPQLALAGGAAALIPVIIHLINRRRHRRVRWAAMGFLLAANRRSLRRIRFEHWTLLLIRMAVIVLLGLAVARPILSDVAFVGAGQATRHHILLIDNSLSASAGAGGDGEPATHPPAVAAALKLLSTFAEADAVSLVTLAGPAEAVLGHAAFDRRAVRLRIAAVSATQRSTDLSGGLAAAARILADSPAAPDNRLVYLVSDQAVATWQADELAADTARRIAEGAKLVLVRTASSGRNNLAVTDLVCTEHLPGTQQPVRLRATVANYADRAAHGITLEIRRADRIVRRVPLAPLEPGGQREVALSVLPTTAGTQVIEAHLEASAPDSLGADDVRRLSLEVFESVPVLLVDGEPGIGKFAGETGYLATAMAPATEPGQSSLLSPRTITELELSGEVLEAYRLICLCNVRRLSAAIWHRLQAYVESGGGLLIFLGDAVGTDNYNRLGYADGQGLLPARLGQPIGQASDRDTFVGLQPEAFTHPAMADFARTDRSGLFLKGRIYRLVPTEPHATRATVVLKYTNDRPAVVEGSFGLGKVCLVTTSANMAWNNLAARGDYVSLIWSLTAYLAGHPGASRNLLPGDSIAEPLSAEQVSQPLRVTGPDGRVDDARLEVADGRYVLRYGPLEETGNHTVSVGRARVHYVANVDPRESDLTVMDESALRGLLECPFAYVSDPDSIGRLDVSGGSAEVTRVLQYMVLLLLVYETWLALRFSNRR